MRYVGGHLGPAVSALVDGQLDDAAAERAWRHTLSCPSCTVRVEHERWVKSRLASMAEKGSPAGPPAGLLRALYSLEAAQIASADDASADDASADDGSSDDGSVDDAWAAVHEIERRGRGRRRAGLALAGAGSVSAAVLGLATLGGVPGGPGGGAPATVTGRPTPSLSSSAPASPVSTLPSRTAPATPGRSGAAAADGSAAARFSEGSAPAYSLYERRSPAP